ncbi:hypothetical protein RB653_006445 [Dictyostelium firmibasis]|uniref:Uncharacterized protein n=1 Tax=Dictyostelium firmibasis TaxID=79012 RepID=A0AAN7U8X7_9MYCE
MRIPLYKQLSKLRVQIVLLSLVGWAVALSIDRTYVEEYRDESDRIFSSITPEPKLDMVRTKNQNAALIILSIFETCLFGLGLGFLVAVGFRVFKIKNSMLRKRMIWCWAVISFFMMEWWPHSTTHFLILTTGNNPVENYITMEATFHWTITACSVILGYFQYDLIKLMYEVAMMRAKMKEGREVDPLKQEWYKNFYYHGIGIGIIVFAICVPVAFHYQPLTPELVTYQRFFYVTFHLVNSAVVALGFTFAYVALRTILLLPPSPGKKVSIISSIAITFLFVIQYPHPFVHTNNPLTMNNTVAIDFGVHIPIVFATGILAFYQFRMLELATDEKSSLSVAAQMRRKSNSGSGSQNASNVGSVKSAENASASFGASSIESSTSKNSSAQDNSPIEMKKIGGDEVTIDINDG